MLHVISLAQFASVYTRSWAVDSVNARVRLKSENCRLRQEFALLQEEIRINDGRMAQIGPQSRPYSTPAERMAILELRATRGWTLQQAADKLYVGQEYFADASIVLGVWDQAASTLNPESDEPLIFLPARLGIVFAQIDGPTT